MKITGRQAQALYSAIDKMNDASVTCDAMTAIHLAINKSKVEAIVLAIERMKKPVKAYVDYQKDIDRLRLKHAQVDEEGKQTGALNRPQEFSQGLMDLEVKYEGAIKQFEKQQEEFEAILDHENEIDLIVVEKSSFKAEGAGSAAVFFGLVPILK
jgi:hypothetical protein